MILTFAANRNRKSQPAIQQKSSVDFSRRPPASIAKHCNLGSETAIGLVHPQRSFTKSNCKDLRHGKVAARKSAWYWKNTSPLHVVWNTEEWNRVEPPCLPCFLQEMAVAGPTGGHERDIMDRGGIGSLRLGLLRAEALQGTERNRKKKTDLQKEPSKERIFRKEPKVLFAFVKKFPQRSKLSK